MNSKNYHVRVVRTVFQVAVLDVKATCSEEAISSALSQAASIPDEKWTGGFDPDSYFYETQYVEEVQKPDDGYISTGINKHRKYLLLEADTNSGEGEVLFQPWLNEISDQMIADLCKDWSEQLEQTREECASRILEQLRKQIQAHNKKPADVIPIGRALNSCSV